MWVDAEVKAADHAPAIAVADACEPAVGPAHEGVQVILGQLLTAVELGPDETVELAERRRIAGRAARVALRVLRVFRLSAIVRSEEHTSELQSLMRISYAVFCLKKKKT